MNAAIHCGHLIRRLAHRSCGVLRQCYLSSSSDAALMHASLHQFTDDECIMRDTGQHLLLFKTSMWYLAIITSHFFGL